MQYEQYEDSQRELHKQGLLEQARYEQVIYFGQLDQVGLAAHQHAAQQMLRKAASYLARSQGTLENVSRELRQRSTLAARGHVPSAGAQHTPRYRGVSQVLSTPQALQWLKAHMQTCTLSESKTAWVVAKSTQQGGHSDHKIVAPKSQRASKDSERVYSSVQAATNKANANQKEDELCELFKENVKALNAGIYRCGLCDKF